MLSQSPIQIIFEPLLSPLWLVLMAGAAAVLLLAGMITARRISWLRLFVFGLLALALFNPSILEEEREPTKNIAVIINDMSPSQSLGERQVQSEKALEYLRQTLSARDNLEIKTRDVGQGEGGSETRIFNALKQSFADIPPQRRAGAIIITDGQAHDIPANFQGLGNFGPVHVLLTGRPDEIDHEVEIIKAPAYGIVGNEVSLDYRIKTADNDETTFLGVTISYGGEILKRDIIPANTPQSLRIPIRHAGQNILEISTPVAEGELTELNNRTAVNINGVRDRLRVLLVSGKPHAGGRTWRDLLTSDPAVDLVHFTILREPSKLDQTPQRELSLIAFPFRELFEVKLYDFDLIIFDRYQLNNILPQHYFSNIVRYVRQGGALLEASGPAFAGHNSLYFTSLMDVLPGAPTGKIYEESFKPGLTQNGLHHPVTFNLSHSDLTQSTAPWGSWLRHVEIQNQGGDVLMQGVGENPLLILDRVEQGRVAQISSDHIWLWSRGYEGGGPHTELLRRIVHWLMKEPALDEKALDLKVSGQNIAIRSFDGRRDTLDITMTRPDGQKETVVLKRDAEGVLHKVVKAQQPGIYSFEAENMEKRVAIIDFRQAKEWTSLLSTPAVIEPLSRQTGGLVKRLSQTPEPRIRLISEQSVMGGYGWLGLRDNNDYKVTGLTNTPLFPPLLWLLLLAGGVIGLWARESRTLF